MNNLLRNEQIATDYSTITPGRDSWLVHIIYSLGPAWRPLLCFRLKDSPPSTLATSIIDVDGETNSRHLRRMEHRCSNRRWLKRGQGSSRESSNKLREGSGHQRSHEG